MQKLCSQSFDVTTDHVEPQCDEKEEDFLLVCNSVTLDELLQEIYCWLQMVA